ncbi:non-ribosomal peptide synthetase [Teredinibacter purpureus]|uniref:non-ribosomal peptide synthetase n=1 Tax=Teredinibacter purpureus TaxID=2731756 RepID=UPI00069776A2|nr:non-ribosomal peptide synthetase [Teredinibacter purpureus]
MTMDDIFELCNQKSIRVYRDKDQLVVKAPKGAMNAEIAALLKDNKNALLERLLTDSQAGGTAADEIFTFRITPEMLTLVDLSQSDIDAIVGKVEGGASNIKDIYPLAPLQEGILFHHLMQENGDIYLLPNILAFKDKTRLDKFLNAMQGVLNRHDVLRTGIVWENLEEPLQVVSRKTTLPIKQLYFDASGGAVLDQLKAHIDPKVFRIDLGQAPLLRTFIAEDPTEDRWLLAIMMHHLVADHTTLELMIEETIAIQSGHEAALPRPVPFRNFIAQIQKGTTKEEHDAFFSSMLSDISEPTVPYDLQDIQADLTDIEEAHLSLDPTLAQGIRAVAKKNGVSNASLFHLAWGLVLARITGRKDVVFGTVLFGRMQGGAEADRGMGLFINTLPIRISVTEQSLSESLKETHLTLVKLLKHEHASLAQAQRGSQVSSSAPLFTALLNYRHTAMQPNDNPKALEEQMGFEHLSGDERTNYPLSLSIDDLGEGFVATVQAREPIRSESLVDYLKLALETIVKQLNHVPQSNTADINVLPDKEYNHQVFSLNDTAIVNPDTCIHALFECQAEKTPDSTALIFEETRICYQQLNRHANQLANLLVEKGVRPDSRVAICLERGIDMVVGLLAILKAGGCYVPLDPAYPVERLAHMLEDSKPVVSLVHSATLELITTIGDYALVNVDSEKHTISQQPCTTPAIDHKFSIDNLAYIIYTSGSTGKPKGVMVTHKNLLNYLLSVQKDPGIDETDVLLNLTSLSFDIASLELFLPLITGAKTILSSRWDAADPRQYSLLMQRHDVSILQATPSTWRLLLEHGWPELKNPIKILCGGEALPVDLRNGLLKHARGMWNMYGPTETAVYSCIHQVQSSQEVISIGRAVANTQLYILDDQLRIVPLGASGELHIGGDGVSRGYFNRDDLTEERFIDSPFLDNKKIYKTGDLCRINRDSNIEYLGRNDFQVKVRGFRIELGEIENKLNALDSVQESAVIAQDDMHGEKQLKAFIITRKGCEFSAASLRTVLAKDLPLFMIPSYFLSVDSMPRTPNGKLDRQSLIQVDTSELVLQEHHNSAGCTPQTETEALILEQWAKLLNVSVVHSISCDQDFFDLGGTSVSMIRMVAFVSKTFGVSLSVGDMFQYRTIQQLATYVDQLIATPVVGNPEEAEERNSGLIALNDESKNVSIFFVPGLNGHALSLQSLATALPAYSIYGFEPIDIHGAKTVSLESFHDLCADYLSLIKQRNVSGPIYLAGHSHGGMVAHMLATTLQSRGVTVSGLIFLDSLSSIGSSMQDNVLAKRNVSALAPDYMQSIFSNFETYLNCDLRVEAEYLRSLSEQERLSHIAEQLFSHHIIPSPSTEFVATYLLNRKRHEDMLTDYVLNQTIPTFKGRACLFKVTETQKIQLDELGEYYGWESFVSEGLDVRVVEGDHESMLQEPYVNTTATTITKWLESLNTQ